MEKQSSKRLLAVITAAHCLLPMSAAAAASFGALPHSVAVAAEQSLGQCGASLLPAAGSGELRGASDAAADKAAAILGGRTSYLDQITRQQAGQATGFVAAPAAVVLPGKPLAPAFPLRSSCARLALPTMAGHSGPRGIQSQPLPGDDFLASKRLRIKRTAFDAAWARVQQQRLPRGVAQGLGRIAPGGPNFAALAAVNAWANAHIRYVEDQALYGKADFWAGARTTLQRRAGDCEDIAIAKLQLLAAIGVPRSDMFLTVARDLARNADHAVLVVRLESFCL